MHTALESATVVNGVVEADLGPIDVRDAGANWSARKVSTGHLVAWLHKHAQARRVVLRGARVVRGEGDPASVDLSDFRSQAALVLRNCIIEEPFDLDGAATGRLEIRSCDLQQGLRLENARVHGELLVTRATQIGTVTAVSLNARGATIEGDVSIVGPDTRLDGALHLVGATIGGQFGVRDGTRVAADADGTAIAADGANIAQDLFIHGQDTHLHGTLRLLGATIDNRLGVVGGAQVAAGADGTAIAADKTDVAQGLFIHGEGTRLHGTLRLLGATIGNRLGVAGGAQIAAGADGAAIDADRIKVAQGLFIEDEGTRLGGALHLGGATIGSQLGVAGGAQIAADAHSTAIAADEVNIAQDLFIREEGTHLHGTLRLGGAAIGSQLRVVDGAQVAAGADGAAIAAEGANIAQDLFIHGQGTHLHGALHLVDASIGKHLAVADRAQVAADADGAAIAAERVNIAQDLFVYGEGTHLDGALCLGGAAIGSQLSVSDAARVAGDLRLERSDVATLAVGTGRIEEGVVDVTGTIDGVVDLSNARVRRLRDTPPGWEQVTGGWRLSGVTIEALPGMQQGDHDWTTKQRVDWLEKDATRSRRPFTQIAGLYRQAGHRRDARKIAIAGEAATSGPWRRLWAGATVGYGYQPWRAAVIALALLILAWGSTSWLGGDELFIPTSGEEEAACPSDHPCLNRFVYMFETVVPVIAFDQRDAWRIDTSAPYGDWMQYGQYVLDGLGWLLALLVVAAVSGVVRQE